MLVPFQKPYGVLSYFTSGGSSNRPFSAFGSAAFLWSFVGCL